MPQMTFERTADSRFLEQYLIDHQDDGLIAYAALSGHIGKDVTGSARGALSTARRALQRDKHVVFGVVRGKGLRKLAPPDIVATAPDRAKRLRRAAKRAGDTLSCADYAALDNDQKITHNTYLSLFGALRAVTRQSGVDRIAAAVAKRTDALPIGRTLELFAPQTGTSAGKD